MSQKPDPINLDANLPHPSDDDLRNALEDLEFLNQKSEELEAMLAELTEA